MVKLESLIWDKYIYPRKNRNETTVNVYTESMKVGAQFPPIEIQRVSKYTGTARHYNAEKDIGVERVLQDAGAFFLIIDGVHRWIAYHKYNNAEKKVAKEEDREPNLVSELEVVEWQPGVVLDYEEHKIDLIFEAGKRNQQHGDRFSKADMKAKARQIALDDPELKYTEEFIAAQWGVHRRTVNEWIKDIRARQKAGRDSKIVKLSRLGWTQEEIAGVVELSQQAVSEITKNVKFDEIGKMLSEGRPMAEIAAHYSIDLALAWALRLEGEEDRFRFRGDVEPETKELKNLRWGLRTWDDWYFAKCDERFGDDCPGRIPAQLVAHTLFYFTRQGNLIMDPMAGGGVVPDVCLAFNRKCRAYDMVENDLRPEIEKHYWNPDDMQWPDMKKKPDLIFLDPPYFTKKAEEYEERAGECEKGQVPISSLSREDYLAFFAMFLNLAHENTKDTTVLAFLNADWRDFQNTSALDEMRGKADNAVTIFDYEYLLSASGWKVTHRIESHLPTERLAGAVVAMMQKKRILGVLGRTLLIAKRVKK